MEEKNSERERVAKELCRLADSLERQESWKQRLMLGLAQGVGVTIGATVVAAIVVSILGALLQNTPFEEFFQESNKTTQSEA